MALARAEKCHSSEGDARRCERKLVVFVELAEDYAHIVGVHFEQLHRTADECGMVFTAEWAPRNRGRVGEVQWGCARTVHLVSVSVWSCANGRR